MTNHVTLHGRFTDVPQLRKTNSGKSVCSFTLAVDKVKREDPADFINCVAWERTAEFVNNYFTRGQEAVVEGRLANRKYEDRDGNKRYVTEVIAQTIDFCGKKDAAYDRDGNHREPELPTSTTTFEELDEGGDLPF